MGRSEYRNLNGYDVLFIWEEKITWGYHWPYMPDMSDFGFSIRIFFFFFFLAYLASFSFSFSSYFSFSFLSSLRFYSSFSRISSYIFLSFVSFLCTCSRSSLDFCAWSMSLGRYMRSWMSFLCDQSDGKSWIFLLSSICKGWISLPSQYLWPSNYKYPQYVPKTLQIGSSLWRITL